MRHRETGGGVWVFARKDSDFKTLSYTGPGNCNFFHGSCCFRILCSSHPIRTNRRCLTPPPKKSEAKVQKKVYILIEMKK